MASSQNEQDNRHYAVAAGLPMLEPSDSQEAYDLALAAFELSERLQAPGHPPDDDARLPREVDRHAGAPPSGEGARVRARHRRPGHDPGVRPPGAPQAPHEARGDPGVWPRRRRSTCASTATGSSGSSPRASRARHAREAAPDASFLELEDDLPAAARRRSGPSRASVERCLVVEEGDPFLADAIRAAGIAVESKPETFRFGELNVDRVRRILANDISPEPVAAEGQAADAVRGCPYHPVYGALRKHDCIVAGDIGCYTLGVLPPYQGMDTCVAMGASLGVGLGLRHVLPGAGREAGRLDHRRLDLHPHRRERPHRDGLQPAGDRPRRSSCSTTARRR